MIDLAPTQLEEVRAILARQLPPGYGVLAFGSRVKGTAKPHSDLDLAVVGPSRLALDYLGCLREAFAESALPIRVDLLDWHRASPYFRTLIAERNEILVPLPHADAA